MIDDVTNGIFSNLKKSDEIGGTNMPQTKSGLDEDFEEELKNRFDLLPQDLQEMILSPELPNIIFEIAKAHQIKYDDLDKIELGTMMVLLGINHPGDLHEELMVRLNRSDEETTAIIKDLDDQIFSKVENSLHSLFSDPGYYEQQEPTETPTPAPAPQIQNNPVQSSYPIKTNPVIEQTTPVVKSEPEIPTLSSSEKNVLEKTGMVLDTPMPVNATPAQSAPIGNRADLLNSIENPTAKPVTPNTPAPTTPSPNIVASKLTMSSTAIPNKTTDYNLPRAGSQPTTPTQNTPKGSDPYREAI